MTGYGAERTWGLPYPGGPLVPDSGQIDQILLARSTRYDGSEQSSGSDGVGYPGALQLVAPAR